MPQVFAKPRGGFALGFVALMLMLAVMPVRAQSLRLPFGQMVEKSDQIVVAECIEKKTELRNGEIITRYRLRPQEFWKGGLKAGSADGDVELEELGGELSGPLPIGSAVTGQADIRQGEDVLLFLRMPAKQQRAARGASGRPPTLSPDLPQIIGMDQGYYSIIRHPETGQRLLTKGTGSRIEQALRQQAQTRAADGDTTGGQKLDQESARIAKMMDGRILRSRAHREQLAKRSPEAAEEIYNLEPLDEVRRRVTEHAARP